MLRRFAICLCAAVIFSGAAWGAESAPEALLEAGHFKRLRAWAEPRLAANPNDALAAFYLGTVKEETGDADGALPLAEKAVGLDPNNARYHLLVANVCIQQAQKAGMFKGMSLAHRFRDEASKAASRDPKNIDAREALMEFYFEAPGMAGGDKKKAWALADEIGKIDPARGLLAQAELAGKEKNPAKQDELYQKGVTAAPHDVRVLVEASGFYVSDASKKYDLAEKYALEALKVDEDRAAPYVALAVVYANGERWKDLDAIIARVEKNVPDDLTTHYQAAKVLIASGKDLPRAERYLRKYLTVPPEGGGAPWAGAHWRLGQALEKEGKKAEAIAELQEALRLQPELKGAKEDLGRLRK